MNSQQEEPEYLHPIWINEVKLSCEFYYLWTILENSKMSLFKKYLRKLAMVFHYATLTPQPIKNTKLSKLVLYINKNFHLITEWCENEKNITHNIETNIFSRNIKDDIEKIRKECNTNKNNYSTVYRKTIPEGVGENAILFLEKFDQYAKKPNTIKFPVII